MLNPNTRCRTLLLALSALSLCAGCGSRGGSDAGEASARYTIQDLGPVDRGKIDPTRIDDSGRVVLNAGGRAYLVTGTQRTDIGDVGGGVTTSFDISGSGIVTGSSVTPQNHAHAVLYVNGKLTDLGTFGSIDSEARGVNDSGQAVGYATDGKTQVAVLASVKKVTVLNDLPGDNGATPTAISDSGIAVGFSGKAGSLITRAVRWSGTQAVDIGTLGGDSATAYSINKAGDIVGSSTLRSGDATYHAALWHNGQPVDLTPGFASYRVSEACAINALGTAVGWSTPVISITRHAYLFSGGQAIDLNDRIDPASGWTLMRADDINFSGQISGTGFMNGNQSDAHAFRLTPQ